MDTITGAQLIRAALDYAGLDVVELDTGALVYELADATAFVVTTTARNNYTVERVDIHAPDGTPPTHRGDSLNMAEVVRVLTFARALPRTGEEDTTAPPTARRKWLARKR